MRTSNIHNLPLSCAALPQETQWWQQRHADILALNNGPEKQLDLLLLGDSITHAWETEGSKAFEQYFTAQQTLNLGFAGDRTEHVLWRLQNGEIDNVQAQYVVLLIGTNNAGHRHDTPEEIAAGVHAIITLLQVKLPHCVIILNAIFARSRHPKKRMRIAVDKTNAIIQSFVKHPGIRWLDMNPHLLDEHQILHESVMPDLLHPNAKQYFLWAKAIEECINQK